MRAGSWTLQGPVQGPGAGYAYTLLGRIEERRRESWRRVEVKETMVIWSDQLGCCR